MKGQELPESIGWTLIFLVLLVGLIMIAFLAYLNLNIKGFMSTNQIAYSADFVSIANTPYMLSDVMTHIQLGDRQILEQSTEAMMTGSLSSAQANSLTNDVNNFMNGYEFKNYRVALMRGDDELMTARKGETKCGDNGAGWCVPRGFGCDVGRIKIDGKECSLTEVCCKPDQSYSGEYTKLPCMNNDGVCSEGETTRTFSFMPPMYISYGPFCQSGQVQLGQPAECKQINNGKTPLCCAERTEKIAVETGLVTRVIIPLLYKNTFGQLEVEAK